MNILLTIYRADIRRTDTAFNVGERTYFNERLKAHIHAVVTKLKMALQQLYTGL
jgi:hypothetical protein